MWTTKKIVLPRRGELPLGAPPTDYSLGERSPEIIVKSLNTGLTSEHLKLNNPFAYTFTQALTSDVEIFKEQHAHALFLCEMGSQKSNASIDMDFQRRCNAKANDTIAIPRNQQEIAIVDNSPDLKQYLEGILKASGLEDLHVRSLPPYACIWHPQWPSVSPPERFVSLDDHKGRRGVKYEAQFRPSGAQFSVVCNHSPSSRKNWDTLTVLKKKHF